MSDELINRLKMNIVSPSLLKDALLRIESLQQQLEGALSTISDTNEAMHIYCERAEKAEAERDTCIQASVDMVADNAVLKKERNAALEVVEEVLRTVKVVRCHENPKQTPCPHSISVNRRIKKLLKQRIKK